ncbi:hypothetical protein CPB84DRAFT_863567 [Gymnopilus junonius]|uniref:Uncharacterized protein n=1 Tax=Gymnopilus junonius TaxID=109634 RepID=A0A9P5NPV5_GYMJU|nr:hypothetical protein CPB84DRAFT_863567 [Gymnopilus junonius]
MTQRSSHRSSLIRQATTEDDLHRPSLSHMRFRHLRIGALLLHRPGSVGVKDTDFFRSRGEPPSYIHGCMGILERFEWLRNFETEYPQGGRICLTSLVRNRGLRSGNSGPHPQRANGSAGLKLNITNIILSQYTRQFIDPQTRDLILQKHRGFVKLETRYYSVERV